MNVLMIYRVQDFGSCIVVNLNEFKICCLFVRRVQNKEKQCKIRRSPTGIKVNNPVYSKANKTFGSNWTKMLNATMYMVTQTQLHIEKYTL